MNFATYDKAMAVVSASVILRKVSVNQKSSNGKARKLNRKKKMKKGNRIMKTCQQKRENKVMR
jgi:hypothetical protein